MTRPRKALVSVETTPYYHIVSRCVRRTFLCGYDTTTDTCYEHRRQWIEERIRLLSSLFAVDICTYAVMSNHYHLVVKLDPEQALHWSEADVLNRWRCLYRGPLLIQRHANGEPLTEAESLTVSDILLEYRKRLGDLGWFMKCLNEPIARQANKEDGCTGHFWEARYKSQALLSEEALLSSMAYVDLNPIRAGMAKTPETSEHTGIRERIEPNLNLKESIAKGILELGLKDLPTSLKPLLPFDGHVKAEIQTGIPFNFADYLVLVDWTGRAIRNDKRGHIPNQLPPILTQLNIQAKYWLENSTGFERRYRQCFGMRRKPTHRDTG